MERSKWLRIAAEELPAHAPFPLRVLPTAEALYEDFASALFDEMAGASGRKLLIVVPLGPKNHYPRLAERINREQLSLAHVTFLGMDNWLDWQGRLLPLEHPSNLEGQFHRLFLDHIDAALRPDPENVIFPSPSDLARPAREIERQGGIATTYGGIGFVGHIAFNEPPCSSWVSVSLSEFRESQTRVLSVTPGTIISTAQRSFGGDVLSVPPMAVTLGMRELLSARRIRLYCEGGAWKQTILRQLVFGQPTVDYPVTLVRDHPDVEVVTDAASASPPLS
jgi:glucosamine-6-phosphate deaminase